MIEQLSQRENEIIAEIAKGYSVKEIAARLFLSPHTVDTHIKNSKRKSGERSLSGLTRLFVMSLENPTKFFKNSLAVILALVQLTISMYSVDIKLRRPRRSNRSNYKTIILKESI